MKNIPVSSLGSPPTFAVPTSDPFYWLLRLCYEESLDRYNHSQQSINRSYVEQSDIEAVETDMSAFATYFRSWYVSAVNASANGDAITPFDKSYLPELAQFVVLLATGQWGLVFVLFVKVGLEFVIDRTEKGFDPETSTGDLVELLRQVMAVLDDNGEIVGSKLDGLSNLHLTINTELSELEERYEVAQESE